MSLCSNAVIYIRIYIITFNKIYYIQQYINRSIHIYVYRYIDIYIYIYMCACVCVCVCVCTYIQWLI